MADFDVLLLNGPNLNLLGSRQPEVYGSITLDQITRRCTDLARELGFRLRAEQSNHEGTLVDLVHEAFTAPAAVLVNAGAYTHTSVALADALAVLERPYIEVHISNVYAREGFRHHSYLSAKAAAVIIGAGPHGYELALRHLRTLVPRLEA